MPDLVPTRPSRPPRTPLDRVADLLGPAVLARTGDGSAVQVTGVSLGSGGTRPGDLYVAAPGSRAHGASFAEEALARGALAVLTDPAGERLLAQEGVVAPLLVVPAPREVLGAVAALVYGHPAERLRLVAVTGTQGKTTVTRLADSALAALGVPSAVVGTVGTRVGGTEVASSLTTPEAPDLHALFAVMVERDVLACAMEVSSHALVMGRVDGVTFDVACFTNLGRDHLDFHASVEDYFAAKASLFTPERARRAVVNVDDEHGRRLATTCAIPVTTVALHDPAADWTVSDVSLEPTGSTFTVHPPSGPAFPAAVPLPGEFNVANALCAIAALGEAGYDAARVGAALGAVEGVPGRLERVEAGQDFLAVVDYAHKPDAVVAALQALRAVTEGRLVIVIGAGGDRDTGKRPLMGEAAGRLADVVVVTDDNPRTEDPASIRAEVLAGVHTVPAAERARTHEVADRRAAIRLAIADARAGDTVVVAGKGHETGQQLRDVTLPFDDRAVLREELVSR